MATETLHSVGEANCEAIRAALRANTEALVGEVADLLVLLGGKESWDLDDNIETTDAIASLAGYCGLPSAHSEDPACLKFYGLAAMHLGYRTDYQPDPSNWATQQEQAKDAPPC